MIYKDCLIIKGIGGFYYVKTSDGDIIECRARGVFRKNGITPLAGDKVTVEVNNNKGTVTEIYERKNFLTRPPVANIDKLIIVSSVKEPIPNFCVIDKLTAIAEYNDITPVVVFSKCDLDTENDYSVVYKNAGIESFCISSSDNMGMDRFKELFNGSVCALTGNTGVGKSSILNCLCPELNLETAGISQKLGRGKHTTRSVVLYELFGGYIADTPGFSSLEIEENQVITKENLQFCFPEFSDFIGKCKFTSCSHINELGCKICECVQNGTISKSRHNSYASMYNSVKNYKEWQNKQ